MADYNDIPSITCPTCGMTSYHPKDIEFRFCGKCDKFHDGSRRGLGGVKLPPDQNPVK